MNDIIDVLGDDAGCPAAIPSDEPVPAAVARSSSSSLSSSSSSSTFSFSSSSLVNTDTPTKSLLRRAGVADSVVPLPLSAERSNPLTPMPSTSKRLRGLKECAHVVQARIVALLDSSNDWEVEWALNFLLMKTRTSDFAIMHGPNLACVHSDADGLRYSVLEALLRLYARLMSSTDSVDDDTDDVVASSRKRQRPSSPMLRHRLAEQVVAALANLAAAPVNQPVMACHVAFLSLAVTLVWSAFSFVPLRCDALLSPGANNATSAPPTDAACGFLRSLDSDASALDRWCAAAVAPAGSQVESCLLCLNHVAAYVPLQYVPFVAGRLLVAASHPALPAKLAVPLFKTYSLLAARSPDDVSALLSPAFFDRLTAALASLGRHALTTSQLFHDDHDVQQPLVLDPDASVEGAALDFLRSLLRAVPVASACALLLAQPALCRLIVKHAPRFLAVQEILQRLLSEPAGWTALQCFVPRLIETVNPRDPLYSFCFQAMPIQS